MPELWRCPQGTGLWMWMDNGRSVIVSHRLELGGGVYCDSAVVTFG